VRQQGRSASGWICEGVQPIPPSIGQAAVPHRARGRHISADEVKKRTPRRLAWGRRGVVLSFKEKPSTKTTGGLATKTKIPRLPPTGNRGRNYEHSESIARKNHDHRRDEGTRRGRGEAVDQRKRTLFPNTDGSYTEGHGKRGRSQMDARGRRLLG